MLLRYIIVCLVAMSFNLSYAQCVVSDFVMPESSSPVACPGKVLDFVNRSQNAVLYEWDFCPGDLGLTPDGNMVTTLSAVQTFDALKIVEDSGKFYGFIAKQSSGGLFRLDFGSDLSSTPSVESMGSLGMGGAADLEFIKDGDVWFALISSASNLIRLRFADGLGGSPASIVSTNLGNFGGALNSVRGLALVKSENDYYAVATSSTLNTLTVIKFAGAMTGPTAVISKLVPGASQLLAVNLIKECDSWYGLLTSVGNNRLIKASLGTDLLNAGAFQFMTQAGVNVQSFGMDVLLESGNYYVFLATINSPSTLFQLNFGNSIWQRDPEIVNRGSLSGLAGVIAMDFVDDDSEVVGFLGNRSNYQLHRVTYPNDCAANLRSSTMAQPEGVVFEHPGDYPITLKAFDSDGNVASASMDLHIYAAPTADFSFDKACVQSNTIFHDETSDAAYPIVSWNWDFGGLSSSNEQHPLFQFPASSDYDVKLEITDSEGCSRTVERNIKIYSDQDITPDFSHPQLFCSNSIMGFEDESTSVEDDVVAWHWSFNDTEGQSNQQNPSYTFSKPGLNKVSLIVTGQSGCSYNVSKEIETLPAPEVSFTLDDNYCEDRIVQFHATAAESLSSFTWDFGDGNIEFGVVVNHVFSNPGQYQVLLTAESANGCVSGRSAQANIRARPRPDFKIDDPPFSCTGVPTPFSNMSTSVDGIISNWYWNFNDQNDPSTSTAEHPEHTFAKPGTYTVSLLSTTEFGCTTEVTKEVTIHESPSADFTHTPACEDVPVSFSAALPGDIAYWYWEIGTSYYYAPSPTHTFLSPGDYPLYVEFYGANGCITESSQIVHIAQPLSVDFSVIKNCVDQDAIFTDITIQGSDPVVTTQWDFGDGTSTSNSPATHTFTAPGTKTVTLQVTGRSGCSYQTSKQVQIIPPPEATFSTFPSSGAYPLEVSFTNSSTGAINFYWEFLDGTGTTSDAVSPDYTFSEEGSFDVTLTAYNAQQCEDSFTQTITTISPLPDVDIELINLVPNADGSAKLIVTLNNKGNTILKSLPLTIDFGGKLSLQQVVDVPIFPGTKFNFVFNTAILDVESLRYLCISLDLEDDLSPIGNRICEELENKLFTFPVYPNPISEELSIEWIAANAGKLQIKITDGLGRQVYSQEITSVAGLNRQRLRLQGFRNGIYFLTIDDGITRNSQRIVIQNSP